MTEWSFPLFLLEHKSGIHTQSTKPSFIHFRIAFKSSLVLTNKDKLRNSSGCKSFKSPVGTSIGSPIMLSQAISSAVAGGLRTATSRTL